jgi:hypothetical protein
MRGTPRKTAAKPMIRCRFIKAQAFYTI